MTEQPFMVSKLARKVFAVQQLAEALGRLSPRLRKIALNHTYLRSVGNASMLQHNYNMEQEELIKMLVSQDGYCGCCSKDFEECKIWCVDHNHETGKVRGLTCQSCNLAIRKIVNMKLYIEYLRKHGEAI